MRNINTFLILYCFVHLTCNHTATPNKKPNIVIIFTDDQGYQDLGCYGSPDIKTPNIDQMAREGLRFTDFYVAQPVCSASRAGLLTGCYPNRIGIHGALGPGSNVGINDSEVTLAEMLKSVGYRTAIFGKWHLGDHPQFNPLRHGFDEYFGIPYSNDMWPFHPWQGSVFNFPDLPLYENEEIIDTLEDQSELTQQITQKAIEFIQANKDTSFFLYVPHPQPHVPLFVSEDFEGKSTRGLYGDVISEIDWSTGQILKTLKDLKIDQNTLIIYASDNGPWLSYGTHSGEAYPLREGKGTAWDGGIRVPCIMRYPKLFEANKTFSIPMMTIDLLPALAEIVGAKLPNHKIDGISMLDALTDKSPGETRPYFIYYHTNQLQAVRYGDWKMYFPHTYRTLNGKEGRNDGLPIPYEHITLEEKELYNLHEDVEEKNNVAGEYPGIVQTIDSLANVMRGELGDELMGVVGKENREVGRILNSKYQAPSPS